MEIELIIRRYIFGRSTNGSSLNRCTKNSPTASKRLTDLFITDFVNKQTNRDLLQQNNKTTQIRIHLIYNTTSSNADKAHHFIQKQIKSFVLQTAREHWTEQSRRARDHLCEVVFIFASNNHSRVLPPMYTSLYIYIKFSFNSLYSYNHNYSKIINHLVLCSQLFSVILRFSFLKLVWLLEKKKYHKKISNT